MHLSLFMCYLLIFCFDDPSLSIPQEATEKLKLSHSTQPETKPVKVYTPFISLLSSSRVFRTLLIQNLLFDGVFILGTWIVFGEYQGTESSWIQANYVHKRCWEWKAHENGSCKGRSGAQVYQVLISEGRPCFVIKSSPLEMYIVFLVALSDSQKA